MIQITSCAFIYLIFSSYVSPFWYENAVCDGITYTDYCVFCYNTDNVMYFLSKIPYSDRCDYIRIGKQKDIKKSEIIEQQDDFMSKQSEEAQKRYNEFKTNRDENEKEEKNKLGEKAKRLSNEAQSLYKKIYDILDSKNISLRQEYQLAHTIINEAKFKTVVEASSLIPLKFYPDIYGGDFYFNIYEQPWKCYYC